MTLLCDTAHAKINLFLHITGQRADGYHLLDSLAVFAGAADRLHLNPEESEKGVSASLQIQGRFAQGLTAGNNNLILRAANLLHQALQKQGRDPTTLPPVKLTLEKELPVASGIGGGSADAACALRLLGQYWKVNPFLLTQIAPLLGADVPVCIHQRPTHMKGIGECLSATPPLPSLGMILVNPGITVPTPAIFKRLVESGQVPTRSALHLPQEGWASLKDFIAFLQTTMNDLQPPAIAYAPVIQQVLNLLNSLPDVLLSRMSGSGATCFALFKDTETAHRAQQRLAQHEDTKTWWHWAGKA